LLDRAKHGVLALASPDGTPYAVPMSYGRDGEAIYFHSAAEGRKLDIARANPKAVLCVVEAGEVIKGPAPCETTLPYVSVLVFGLINEVLDPAAKMKGLRTICRAHGIEAPSDGEPGWAGFCRQAERTAVLRLVIEEISCKGRA